MVLREQHEIWKTHNIENIDNIRTKDWQDI